MPRPGRPRRNPDAPTVRLTAWVSPVTYDAIYRRATKAGLSVGAYLDRMFSNLTGKDPK